MEYPAAATRPRGGADVNHGSGLILTTSNGPVSVLTLNRPSRRNALNRDMLLALGDVLAQVRMDARVSVVVLTGAGSSFCAGVDISDEGRRSFYQPPQQIERLYQENGQGVVRALQSLPQVTVAAANGPAIGWGACLATCCDFRVVAAEAFFRIPEIGLGMYYDVGCLYGLLVLVGPARAKRMTMLGDDIDAVEALRTGLADDILSATDLMTAVDRAARSLLCRDSATQRNAKRRGHGATVGRRRPLGLMESEFTAVYYGGNLDRFEALAAFEEKRAPLFSRELEAGTLMRPPQRGEGGETHGFPSD